MEELQLNSTSDELRILIVEDSEDDALLLLRVLKKSKYNFSHKRVYSEADMRHALAEARWDIIISDYMIPGFSGLGALQTLKEYNTITPFILVSSKITEEQAVEIMKKGANDFVPKQNLSRLIPAIERELNEAKVKFRNLEIEEQLKANYLLLDKVFSSISVMIAYMDANFNFIKVNPNYARSGGHEPDFFIGRNHFDLYPNPENEEIFKQVVETKQPYVVYEKPFEYKEFPERGITYWDWNLQPIIENDVVVGLILSLIEVTDRVKDREKAQESEIQFKTLFNSANDAIFIHDLNGNIIEVNKLACDRLGYPHEELITKNLYEINTSENIPLLEKRLALLRDEGDVLHESLHRKKNGDVVPVEINSRVIEFKKRKAVLSIVRDITERKRYENELKKAKDVAENANRAKSEFLTNMSHEIRTPMNSIIGMADLLSETSPTKEQKQYIDIFREAGEHLMKLINDILEISRIESGTLVLENTLFDPAKSIRKTWDILSVEGKKKNLVLELSIPSDMPEVVVGDATKLERVLINIIGNAMKFTAKGSVIVDISQKLLDKGELELSFKVKDTGIGIPADKQDMLFHKFTQLDATNTRQYGGTGLGLVISKRLIELMGGNISLESEVGKGSTFYFTLKFKTEKRANPDKEGLNEKMAEAPVNKENTKEANILLVEDSFDNRRLIELYLKKFPYKIDTADNGEIAVEKFKSNQYSLVLMDIQMPVMDGYAATREIRRWEKENNRVPTPVVALTANAFKEDEENCYKAGCDMFITKPVKKTLLLDVIEKLLDKNL